MIEQTEYLSTGSVVKPTLFWSVKGAAYAGAMIMNYHIDGKMLSRIGTWESLYRKKNVVGIVQWWDTFDV